MGLEKRGDQIEPQWVEAMVAAAKTVGYGRWPEFPGPDFRTVIRVGQFSGETVQPGRMDRLARAEGDDRE